MTQVTIWGARGSMPVTGPEIARYGGNTPCIEVEGDGGTRLILDAGTGIRKLGRKLTGESKQVHLLLTHLHMDHIQGLGFFSLLYDPEAEVHIWGPASPGYKLQTRLGRYLSPPLFPVRLRDLPANIVMHDLGWQPFNIGEFRITATLVCHPDPTVGFRIEAADGVLTYLPDHEPALGLPNFPLRGDWTSGYSLAAGADILIHDCQYTAAEYPQHVGWGHSSIDQTLKFATLAGVRTLVAFHHDPACDDDVLDEIFAPFSDSADLPFTFLPAREGMRLSLGG